jgi:protein O-GlcNAc transferase
MAKRLTPQAQDVLQRAFALFQRGEFRKAEDLARGVLPANARNPMLLQFVGILCHSQQRHAEAVELFAKAIRLDSSSPEAHYNMGTALVSLGRWAEAVQSLNRSLASRPGNPDALRNLGLALNGLERFPEAEAALRKAIAAVPGSGPAYFALGVALRGQKRFEEAAASLKRALALGRVDAGEAHECLGEVFFAWNRSLAAIENFQKSLQHRPKQLTAMIGLAEAEARVGRYLDAAEHFAQAHELAPGDAEPLIGMIFARRHVADWREARTLDDRLSVTLDGGAIPANPFRTLSLRDDPALHLKISRKYAARQSAHSVEFSPTPRSGEQPKEKLRIAYVSGDFRIHPVAFLAAGLFEHHDRRTFETFAYSWGGDGSPISRRLQAGFDHFVDVGALSDAEVAQRISYAGVDIAVDLQGFTGPSRSAILTGRPAPVQVSYLGQPGTMGAAWIDYIIADRFLIPPAEAVHYSESIVYLPDCYQVNDSRRSPPGAIPERAAVGLPPEAFVFAAFNSPYKITPAMFDVWTRLLDQVPSGVLWLYCRDDREGRTSADNLRREAGARGIAADRLVFAPRVPLDEHIQRLQCADLFLDTFPYGGGATTSDALWAGLPLVTCAGRSYVARMAGSLLTAAGLPELVAPSLAEYEAIAFRLATDSAARTAARARLAARSNGALFDTARFTRNLEVAYRAMWDRHSAGEAPRAIDLGQSDAG